VARRAPPADLVGRRVTERGRWVADWSGLEVEPYPVTTIACLTWHIGWWWSTTIAHATTAPVPERADVTWPGSAASL
jgi:hypothetical protein